MNVLYIAASCNPFNGSEDQIGWNIPYYASKKYNAVYVVTDLHQKKYIDKYLKKEKINNLHFFYVDIPDVYKKIFNGFLFSTRFYFWMKEAFKISKKICYENNIDIIHQITPVEFRMIGKFKKIKDIKFIVGPIGGGVNTPKVFKKYARERWFIEFIRETANSLFSIKYRMCNLQKKYDYIMYSNEETAKIFELENSYNNKIYTEIGINDSNICKRIIDKNTDTINFVVVGRLVYLKGHEFLLDVIEKINKKYKFTITFVGEGPKYDRLHNRVMGSDILKERVSILGKVDFDKMTKIYDDSHILILPSIRENTGTVVLEAMSRGLPVILYNGFGGKLLVNSDNGWLYCGDSLDDVIDNLVKIIESILINPSIINKKSINALHDAKQYTWYNKVEKFDEIYKELLGDTYE